MLLLRAGKQACEHQADMAQQPAWARLCRWRLIWPHLFLLLLCQPQIAVSILEENESRQLKNILTLTLSGEWGEAPG